MPASEGINDQGQLALKMLHSSSSNTHRIGHVVLLINQKDYVHIIAAYIIMIVVCRVCNPAGAQRAYAETSTHHKIGMPR